LVRKTRGHVAPQRPERTRAMRSLRGKNRTRDGSEPARPLGPAHSFVTTPPPLPPAPARATARSRQPGHRPSTVTAVGVAKWAKQGPSEAGARGWVPGRPLGRINARCTFGPQWFVRRRRRPANAGPLAAQADSNHGRRSPLAPTFTWPVQIGPVGSSLLRALIWLEPFHHQQFGGGPEVMSSMRRYSAAIR